MSQTRTASGDQGNPTKMAGDNGTTRAKRAKGENMDLKIKKNSDGKFSLKIVLSNNCLSLLLVGALMLVFYGCKIIGRNQVPALSLAIMICTIYLIYDFAASEDGMKKIRKSMERFEKEFFPNQSKIEPSSDKSEPKETQEEVLSKLVNEVKDLNSMTRKHRDDISKLREAEREESKLLEAEREKSKWLEADYNRLLKEYQSGQLAINRLRNQESVYKKELEQARKFEGEVKELKEEVTELEDEIESINEALDTERVKNKELKEKADTERVKFKELKEKAEKSKVEMEKKDVLVKILQGELEKHKNLEELKLDVACILKGEIAQLRRVRGEEERMEVLKLEKKLTEVEAEKEELIYEAATIEQKYEELKYSHQVLAEDIGEDLQGQIESLRDLFNQQVLSERERIAKLLEHQETLSKLLLESKAQSEQADTSSNDDEGYEVVREI